MLDFFFTDDWKNRIASSTNSG